MFTHLLCKGSTGDSFRLSPGRHIINVRFIEDGTSRVSTLQFNFTIGKY